MEVGFDNSIQDLIDVAIVYPEAPTYSSLTNERDRAILTNSYIGKLCGEAALRFDITCDPVALAFKLKNTLCVVLMKYNVQIIRSSRRCFNCHLVTM